MENRSQIRVKKNTPTMKLVVFICNWGPHTAMHTLQEQGADIPHEIGLIRVPCAGRINRALLLRAFEMGADGVALLGCAAGACRYGSGTETAVGNIDDMQEILDLLGIGRQRLRLGMSLPDEAPQLLQFLKTFTSDIQALGKSPVKPQPAQTDSADTAALVRSIIAARDVFACQDCGKCSSACPLALTGKNYSPRAIANAVIAGDAQSETVQKDVRACLTCGLCHERCPSDVNFPEFIRDLRSLERPDSETGREAHEGFFQSLMRTMASPGLTTRKWQWLGKDVAIDAASTTLFWGGCAAYFDYFFRNFLAVKTRDILVDSLKLLNFFDIKPAVLEDERCCGHDLLWAGDKENFLRLAKLNAQAIKDRGIKEIITACPECYRTFVHDYPAHGIELACTVTHLYDRLEEEIDKGAVGFKKLEHAVTFQDPCRLSRLEGKADLPRKLISRLKTKGFQEMQDYGAAALCCGNCAWTGCDAYSKKLQVLRLKQARATGSDLLITSCPKCQIHLTCAMEDPMQADAIKMDMMDLTGVLVKTLRWE
jgi:Fe-S oxidoreductase/coenzyme F420-reducing hydrogenase delta subunit